MATQRELTIAKLMEDAANDLGNLVKWPASEATRESAVRSVKALRKYLKEDGYPDIFRAMCALQVANGIFHDCAYRDVRFSNYKQAWITLADVFDGKETDR